MYARNLTIKITIGNSKSDSVIKENQEKITKLLQDLYATYEVVSDETVHTFLDDVDKVYDFLELSKEEFLQSYSYLTEEEYNTALKVFESDRADHLANFMRTAENMLIEENSYDDNTETNPYRYCNVTGEQFKERIYDYVLEHLSAEERQDFEDYCYNMAC